MSLRRVRSDSQGTEPPRLHTDSASDEGVDRTGIEPVSVAGPTWGFQRRRTLSGPWCHARLTLVVACRGRGCLRRDSDVVLRQSD